MAKIDSNRIISTHPRNQQFTRNIRWAHSDLNRGPRDYESPALTAELQARLLELDLHLAKSLVQCLIRRWGDNLYAAAEDAGKVVRKRLC